MGTEYGPQYYSPFRCETMKFQAPKPVSVNLKEDYSIPERCMGMRHMLRKFKGEDLLPAPCARGHGPPALGHGEVLGVFLTRRWAAGGGGILAEAFGRSRLCKRLCRGPSTFRFLFNDVTSEQTPFQTRFFLLAPVLWVFFFL